MTTEKNFTDNKTPTHFWRCAKCRNLISEDDCPYCAGIIPMPETETAEKQNDAPAYMERFRIAAISAMIFGLAGIFIFPLILSTLSIIIGIIVIAVNSYEKFEGLKPVWKYKNKTLWCGWTAYYFGNAGLIIMIVKLIIKGMIK